MHTGDMIGFSVIHTDWSLQVLDVHIKRRGKIGAKNAKMAQNIVWQRPQQMQELLAPPHPLLPSVKVQVENEHGYLRINLFI